MLELQHWEGRLGKTQCERLIFFVCPVKYQSSSPWPPYPQQRTGATCRVILATATSSSPVCLRWVHPQNCWSALTFSQASTASCPRVWRGHHIQLWIQVILKWIGCPKFHTGKKWILFFSTKFAFSENNNKVAVVWSLLATSRVNDTSQKKSLEMFAMEVYI